MEKLLTKLCDVAAATVREGLELELFEETKMSTKSYLTLALRRNFVVCL